MSLLLIQAFSLLTDAPLLLPREYPPLRQLEAEVRTKEKEREAARRALTLEPPKNLTLPYATYHLATIEAELAAAEARLAEARGDRKRAAAEWRKVVAHAAVHVEVVRKLRVCMPVEEMNAAVGYLAEVRCRLAEIERDGAVLKAELPKHIASLQARAKRAAFLLAVKAISPEEGRLVQSETEKELRRARALLDAFRPAK
ncbi:MAG: hypothetical protein U0793_05865 [Gemmataceae bacterium]